MEFSFVDRIIELSRGQRIVAVKAVSLAEEYLADHFPSFPVLPGVLMLEALAEAAGWMVRDAQGFAASVVLLREARNVTYKSFVKPGDILRMEVTCRRMSQGDSDFDGVGYSNQTEVVKARFGLVHYNLKDRNEALAPLDQRITAEARARFVLLQTGNIIRGAG